MVPDCGSGRGGGSGSSTDSGSSSRSARTIVRGAGLIEIVSNTSDGRSKSCAGDDSTSFVSRASDSSSNTGINTWHYG